MAAAAGTESCNGQDDDCDGATDEGFGVGDPCTTGVGACQADGTVTCKPDGTTTCTAQAGGGSNEACNGQDDDCDGETDEDYPVGDPCTVGTGGYAKTGTWACQDGAAACSATPSAPEPEACNTLDDDCDGQTDEDFALDVGCTTADGICQTEGTVACGDTGAPTCVGTPAPSAEETCDNGLDDDCDGSVNEDCACDIDATTLPCGQGAGACELGVATCTAGKWSTCEGAIGPTLETCNGVDDDCDGTTDEGCPCTNAGAEEPCGLDEGACATGTRTCANSRWSECSGAAPTLESCNELDDDCDGLTDETCPTEAVGPGAETSGAETVTTAEPTPGSDIAPTPDVSGGGDTTSGTDTSSTGDTEAPAPTVGSDDGCSTGGSTRSTQPWLLTLTLASLALLRLRRRRTTRALPGAGSP